MDNKILIVDDERMVIMQVSELLSAHSYNYNFVAKPRLLMKKLEVDTFDLILLDINMPEIDGITLLKQLKRHEKYHNIPIIMMTGSTDDQTLATCFKYGADDYIAKPIQELVLMARVNSTITRQNYLKKNLEQQQLFANRITELTQKEVQLEELMQYITKSVDYAKAVQQAILFSSQELQAKLPQSFVFRENNETGDNNFYWFAEIKEGQTSKMILAMVDETSTGIPGAFMALMVNDCLNQVVKQQKTTDPKQILTQINQHIQQVFKSTQEHWCKGIGMSLCVIDLQNQQLEFAGAQRSLMYVQNNCLEEINGDDLLLGRNNGSNAFTSHKIDLKNVSICYLFSNACMNQFEGKSDSKTKKAYLQSLLTSLQEKPIKEQASYLETVLLQQISRVHDKEKPLNQIDSMLAVGFRINVDP